MKRGRAALVAGIVCLLPPAALAQTVITQKDLPLTIRKSGSYVLGGSLKVTDPAVTAISVAADNVTIDLNGFTIEGPPGGPSSHGAAILNTRAGGNSNVVVRNGTVRGFFMAEAACIHLGAGGPDGYGSHRVENVHVHECSGIAIYADGVVTRCQVTKSMSGIGVGTGSTVSDNTLRGIEGIGVHTVGLESGITIARNSFYGGGAATCIRSWGANRIEDNTCYGGAAGLVLTDGRNLFARNFVLQAAEPVVDGGGNNVDGGGNVLVPAASVP